MFTIIGPNGAGKTTIFNLISRIYEPSRGRLSLRRGHHAGGAHEIARVGASPAPPEHRAFQHATVLQNLMLGRHAHRRSPLRRRIALLPRVRRLELAPSRVGGEGDRLPRLQPHRDSLIANLPYGVRKVSRWRGRCARSRSSCCWTSVLRPQRGGDRGHGFWIQDIRSLLGITC